MSRMTRKRVVQKLTGFHGVLADQRETGDAIQIAPALTWCTRAEVTAFARWLFNDGDAPSDKMIAKAVRHLDTFEDAGVA